MPGLFQTTKCMSLFRNCQFDCYNVSSQLDREELGHLSKADLFASFQWCRTHGKQSAQAGETRFLCCNSCGFGFSRGRFICYISLSLLVTFASQDAVQVWINMSKSWITARCYSQDLGYALCICCLLSCVATSVFLFLLLSRSFILTIDPHFPRKADQK